jgi:hypothetical protein
MHHTTRTLALFYTLLIFTSIYPQPLFIHSSQENKSSKKLFYKHISAPPTTPLAERVSISGLFSLPIMQQPNDNPVYVSSKRGILTQFQQATQNGITGLLAHNYLSGREFYKIKIGQEISITYKDKIVRNYRVSNIYQYQKLNPSDLFSTYIDLHTDKEQSTKDVFERFYRGHHHVTLQTCLEKEGRLDWGLIFIVAQPVN